MVDDEEDEDGARKVLFAIDIQSGDIVQRVHVDLIGDVTAILVEGNELYIADFEHDRIVVLQLAGSEA